MLNKVFLVGTLKEDPTVREFESGRKLVRFLMLTEEHFGENTVRTTHIVESDREYCIDYAVENLHKDDLVLIDGGIRHRSYEAADGQKKYVESIRAHYMKKLN